MFFESFHSLSENEFQFTAHTSITFPTHLHRAFEYFEQRAGATEVTVGDCTYLLRAGEAILIFPMQPHSYRRVADGAARMCIFSSDLVSHFHAKNGGWLPLTNRMPAVLPTEVSAENIFHKKALAYYICGEFEKGREYTPEAAQQSDRLLTSLLLYADKHFCTACLLRDAASEIGYDYTYVSKLFKRRIGISFRQYVNGLRIAQSKQLLRSTPKSVEEIAEASGFSSLRAFDREFREQTHMTPSQYRAQRLVQ